MEREINNKTNMLITVDQFLDNNQSKISSNPAIVEAHARLKLNISEIRGFTQKQSGDSTVETTIKEGFKETLIASALKVAAGIGAYAATTNDIRLEAIAKVSKNSLEDMREVDFENKIQAISEAAKPITAQLVIWGVSPRDIDSLEAKSSQFLTQAPAQRNVVVITSQATKELNKKVNDTVSYVKNTLDAFMLPFKTLDPTFHGEYINARKIIDTAATHKPGETPQA